MKLFGVVAACLAWLSASGSVLADDPGAKQIEAAIASGDIAGYYANVNAWLDKKTPDAGKIDEATITALVKDPVFRMAVNHRQFIAKHGADELGAFAKVAANKPFLTWVMTSNEILDLYLEALAPSRDRLREANEYKMAIAALERWKQLYTDDPDTRAGLFLKLGMAAAMWPRGCGGQYRGEEPGDWVDRYKHFKDAAKNGELVPSFDHLLVNDYGSVLNSVGSNSDCTWVRKMVQTWRPDMLEKEQIHKIVSEVWRRSSPIPFTNGFVTVMEGGGKCGPRGMFGTFVLGAFGIPTVLVGQPAHCCFAGRCDFPETDPQAGSVWKVYQGRGWQVSDCGDAMYGAEFTAEKLKRYRTAEFSMVEHCRWLASSLPQKDRADALRALANKIRKPVNTSDPMGVPATEVDVVLAANVKDQKPREWPKEEPIKVAPGVIHVEAEDFTNMLNAQVFNCYTGGKQVDFFKSIDNSWLDYVIDAPEAGTYALEVMLAAANRDLILDVSCGEEKLGTVKIPGTQGLWRKMDPVDIKLKKGPQTIRISAPFQRGIAIRWFELTPKK